ncbi:uncharacterized protein PpBr36_05648 [Pyricularia pennisetigena]|uniref:uncharacterized protein n=1 Tax=Pyricularia pennisetigena TaxID=1578925 RepID=UPI00114EB1D3|nr:uncharacterized protein PpBr36_05648 [Pyricularia pennisetigena]TLS23470.1 hypothetical protein PpBr36_05648 [Pyricularia pennisetigena]
MRAPSTRLIYRSSLTAHRVQLKPSASKLIFPVACRQQSTRATLPGSGSRNRRLLRITTASLGALGIVYYYSVGTMSSKLIPDNPAEVMVIRNITPNVVTMSVPFKRFGHFDIGGRGTIVRLTSGSLAVFSPVALTPDVKTKVAEMGGKLQYIVATDIEHHIFVSDWKKEYPDAHILGPEGLPEKRAKVHNDERIGKEAFHTVFTKAEKGKQTVTPEFDADFTYEFVDAHPNKELVFLYRPDRVLIQADMLFNLPAIEQYSRVPEAAKPKNGLLNRFFTSVNTTAGDAMGIKRFLWYAISSKDREGFNKSVQRINEWDFVTIVPCHGETIEGNGKEVFEKRSYMLVHGRRLGLRLGRSHVAPSDRATAKYTSHIPRRTVHLNHFVFKVIRAFLILAVGQASEAEPPPQSTFTLAVKDNIATQAHPTTCASNILREYTSPYEATVVRQLRSQGARVIGTTNLDEFGMGTHSTHSAHGPVANPAGRSAGGSSGGSAVAVAVGEAEVALGTDTGGSVRLPAAYNGVVGFKPSYGMLSRYGVVPYANSLDTVGVLTRSVERIRDLVVAKGLWAQHDDKDPTSLSVAARLRCARGRTGYEGQGAKVSWERLTFGIPLEYNILELDASIREAWEGAAALLQSLGANVVPVSLPTTRHALSAYYVLAPAEASSNLAKYDGVRYGNPGPESEEEGVLYSAARGAGFGDEVKRRILLGAYSLSSEAMDNYFVQAQKVRRLVRGDFDRAFLLDNPLVDKEPTEEGFGEEGEQVDLADLHEDVPLVNKRGPAGVDFILSPTAPTPAPTLDEALAQTSLDSATNDVFTVPASLAGLPAISLPVDVKAETDESSRFGGMQIIGQYWDDARLLNVASALRKEFGRAGMDEHAARDEVALSSCT